MIAHEGGVPNVVLYQLLNFALFFIIMFVILRKKIVAYFADKDACARLQHPSAQFSP